ncbi:MAG: hypothetical protein RL139_426 [Gemmatimonadota bacterium]
MRRTLRLLILVLLVTAPAIAQETAAPRTHTVREGDTLWDIATLYLKDPFRWAEIHAKNKDKIHDPHWIYPGQVLDLVEVFGDALDSTAVAPATSATGAAAAAATTTGPSIFAPRRPVAVPATVAASEAAPSRALFPLGELMRLPYLVGPEGVTPVGEVGRLADANVGVRATRFARPIQTFETALLSVRAGTGVSAETRLVAFRYGPSFDGRGRVLIPTGVFRVLGVGENGAAEARLMTAFEDVAVGQSLVVLDTVVPAAAAVRPVADGARLSVLWVAGDALIPGPGQAVILAPSADGTVLSPGDQVTVTGRATEAGEAAPVATLRVMKVTRQGVSATLITQGIGRLTPGMEGRVTARMP